MHYIHAEKPSVEHVQYLDENQLVPYVKSWVNISEAHEIDIVQVGFHYYVKVVFSPFEHYYIASFESEKHAKSYVHHLLD